MTDDCGTTLYSAIENCNVQTVDTRLKAGADFNKKNYDGKTLLMEAATWENERSDFAVLLRQAGADAAPR